MKASVLACAGLAVAGLVVALVGQGQAQAPAFLGAPGQPQMPAYGGGPGFGGPGAPNQPWMPPTSPPGLSQRPTKGPEGSKIPEHWNQQQEDPDINRDLLVTPACGPWLLFVHSFDEANGPSLARALCLELRGPNYGLPAYVWNYNDEERRAELERLNQEIERRRAAAAQLAGPGAVMRMRRPRMLIRVQCAVLIGGYKDPESARRDLEQRIKKLPPLDADRFNLPKMMFGITQKSGNIPGKDLIPSERAAINPFLRAFAVRNPAVKAGQAARDVQDLATLQRLNADEGYSLLKCRKAFTLAVKQFQLPTVVESRGTPPGFWQKFGLGGSSAKQDPAKESARNLAEGLRKRGWDSYVLHTRFTSIVTVGAYDGPHDPRLQHDQEELFRFNQQLARCNPNVDVGLFPRAIPMPVPR
jgi:hypothetical protein